MQILQEQKSVLQTLPHGNALVFSLAFGSTNTWQEDFHLSSFVPCPAHTLFSRRVFLRRLHLLVMDFNFALQQLVHL